MSARALLGAVVFAGFGCGDRSSDSAATAARARRPPAAAGRFAGRHRARGRGGVVHARPAGDSADGRRCVDRAIEIRRGGTRVPVPLLYTGEAPEIVNDTTLRARLSNGCRPGDAYLVDLRTGRPVRERR